MIKSVASASAEEKKVYNGLDLFKFIMAVFVVILHAQPMLDISYDLNYAVSYGTRIRVPFFFMVSGFLLYRKMDLDNLNIPKIKKYLKHILRLYGVWTLIYMPIIVYGIFKDKKGIIHGGLAFIRDTLMSGSYMQLWYLQAMIVAACIVSTLLYFKLSTKWILGITGILYSVALIGTAYYGLFDYFFPEGTLVYQIFHLLGKIFVTPRDGIFLAPIFFFLGAYFSKYNVSVNKIKTIIVILAIGLMTEVMLGSFYGFSDKGEVYILSVPLTVYLFIYAKNLQLKNSPLWLYLRKQSMYIFYIHAWFLFLVSGFFGNTRYSLVNIGTLNRFLIVILLSFIFGHIIIKLTKYEKFKFLKYLS